MRINVLETALLGAMLVGAALGCSDSETKEDDDTCDPNDATSCDGTLVCEQLGESRFTCLPPIVVAGRVFGALDAQPIANATVVGIDANGAARTRVARSGSDGRYELPVSVKRKDDGTPIEDAITLRVGAADHQPFPRAPRTALPIQLAAAVANTTMEPRTYRVENAATDVSLLQLPPAQRGGATVTGSVSGTRRDGVLVLAVRDGRAQSSAISDRDGAFVLFNVAPGSVVLEGYRSGVALTAQPVEVPAAGLTNVALAASSAKLATVNGNLSIVNATGGLTTSVILVVASTFDENLVRGEAPLGLRVANVSGAFQFVDVPPGRYRVLAGFENDQLVRDPDTGIGGTAVVSVDVGDSGAPITLSEGFKVTAALAVVAPGAQMVEEIPAAPATLTWADDSSEDGYELRVYDALGALVHEDKQVARVTGAPTVSYTLNGAASFTPGMLYQFRVYSFRERQSGRTYISSSEDLRGVFQIRR